MAVCYWVGGTGGTNPGVWTSGAAAVGSLMWASTSGGVGGSSAAPNTGGTDTAIFDAFSVGPVVTVAAGSICLNLDFNAPGITLTFAADNNNFAVSSSNGILLTAGTIDLAGFSIGCGAFRSSNTNTRSIAFGTGGAIQLINSTAATVVLSMATATGFSWTGTGGFIRSQTNTATVNFGTTGGGSATNAPNLTVNAGSSALSITGTSFFKDVNFTGSSSTVSGQYSVCGTITLAAGGVYTGLTLVYIAPATLTDFSPQVGGITISAPGSTITLGSNFTLPSNRNFNLFQGTLDLNGFTLSTGVFLSTGTTTRAIAFGSGNIALTSTVAATTVLSMANATNFTWTGTGGFTRNQAATATVAFGTTGGTISNAPNLTVNAGASTLTISVNSYFKNVNFTGSTCTVTANLLNMAGNLTLASGGTYTAVVPTFLGSGTFSSNTKPTGNVTIDTVGGTITLGSNSVVGTGSTTTLTNGTLALAGFTLSTGVFISSNSNTRAIAFGANNITLTSTTAAAIVLAMPTATNFTWTGTGGFIRNQAATATVSFGITAGGTVANAPNLTVNAGASALTIATNSYFKNVDFTGSTCTVTATNLNTCGNLTLASGGTYTAVAPTFLVSGTLTTNNKTISALTINS